jgi:hypothetical protein
MTKRWRMRLAVVGVLAALVVALGVSVAIVVADPPPPSPSKPPPPQAGDFKPAPPPGFGPKPTTLEEERRWREEIVRLNPGYSTPVSGPETLGATITVAGKTIKLPPDAYLGGELVAYFGACNLPSPCPETPILLIQRGNSTIGIVMRTGQLVENPDFIKPGEERLFDFLREALR